MFKFHLWFRPHTIGHKRHCVSHSLVVFLVIIHGKCLGKRRQREASSSDNSVIVVGKKKRHRGKKRGHVSSSSECEEVVPAARREGGGEKSKRGKEADERRKKRWENFYSLVSASLKILRSRKFSIFRGESHSFKGICMVVCFL